MCIKYIISNLCHKVCGSDDQLDKYLKRKDHAGIELHIELCLCNPFHNSICEIVLVFRGFSYVVGDADIGIFEKKAFVMMCNLNMRIYLEFVFQPIYLQIDGYLRS